MKFEREILISAVREAVVKDSVSGETINDSRWALAQRIVASSHLSSSPKLIEFFLYVVDCYIRQAPEEATEQQIGVHVFHRIPGYNSSDDSIVRSQARLLRMKLTAYFASDGRDEELIVEIPKGHYLPVFRPAAHVDPVRASSPRTEPVSESADPPADPPADSSEARFRFTWKQIALVCLCLALGGFAGFLVGTHMPAIQKSDTDPFWKPFFTDEPPLIIYSNPLFKGDPYAGLRLVPRPDLADSPDYAGTPDETYTGTGEVTAVYELTRIFDLHHANFTLKRSRLVTWDEAKLRNLVFVGAPSQNGALQDLPTMPDFVIDLDGNHKGYILNKHPRSGEPQRFVPSSPNDEYAIIASIPGIQPERRIAVFTGLTTNGTQAAVEFACSPEEIRLLTGRVGQTKGVINPFEAILHIKLSGGVPLQTELETLHQH